MINTKQNLEVQFDIGRPTPSLREDILHAIKVHKEALEQPNLDRPFVKKLDSLQDQIEEHWSRVYKSCIDHSNFMAHLAQYQLFFTELLLSEYTGAAFSDTQTIEWLHRSATHIKKAATDVSDEFRAVFNESIVSPVEELLLNRPHVEMRMLLAAANTDRPPPLGGHIQYLIKHGHWQDLAKYLYHDRELALGLFKYQPIVQGLFDDGRPDRVLQGITSIQDKYFTDISSPTEYTTSKYTKDLETVKQTSDTSYKITATPSAVERHKPSGDSPSARIQAAMSIFNVIEGGIPSWGTHSGSKQASGQQVSMNATTDEKTLLADEKES